MKHTITLFEAGGQVSDLIKFVCHFKLENHLRCYFNKARHWKMCRAEFKNMALVLRNALPVDDTHKLRLLVANQEFERAVAQVDKAGNRYPIYGYLLKARYRRGMMRRRLLEETTWALRQLGSRRLSTECAEVILQYLTDEELTHLAQAVNV